MTLWIFVAALTLGVLALLLWPILRRMPEAQARVDYDLMVYRDQLAEVDRDVERGVVNAEQAQAARTEIQRRMLTAADAESEFTGPATRLERWLRVGVAACVGVVVPAGALALYLVLGTPTLPGLPFASRQADPAFQMTRMVDNLIAELKAKPEPDGYATLAATLFTLKRYDEAAEAYRKAIELGAVDAEMLASMAESIVMVNDGSVVPEARQAFQHALTLDATDPRARFYLGLAKAQIGKYAEAVAIWRDLEKSSPAEAPWLGMLKEHIAEYAKMGGFEAASIAPVPPAPMGAAQATGPNPHAAAGNEAAPAGSTGMPSGAAAEAVLAQSPEDRARTIRSMVDGLAARLEQNPDDKEGWARLSRAYTVLGEPDKARKAAERAEGR